MYINNDLDKYNYFTLGDKLCIVRSFCDSNSLYASYREL